MGNELKPIRSSFEKMAIKLLRPGHVASLPACVLVDFVARLVGWGGLYIKPFFGARFLLCFFWGW